MRWLALAFALFGAVGTLAADLFNHEGYRVDRFRAPVDRPAEGFRVVDTAEVHALGNAVLRIDTTPLIRNSETDFSGRWLQSKERLHLPGSIWLPNIGRMPLDDTIETFFREQLERWTEGDPTRPVVFYCYLDCWMSWNAARQAVHWGYDHVLWYPEGSDGWKDAGLPLVAGKPEPLFEE